MLIPGFLLDVRKKNSREKNSSFEKTQANFQKNSRYFSKNSQIRQLPPDEVALKIFSHENGEENPSFSINRPFWQKNSSNILVITSILV